MIKHKAFWAFMGTASIDEALADVSKQFADYLRENLLRWTDIVAYDVAVNQNGGIYCYTLTIFHHDDTDNGSDDVFTAPVDDTEEQEAENHPHDCQCEFCASRRG